MQRNVATVRWLARLITPGTWLLLATWGLTQMEPARLTVAPYARLFCFAALGAAGLLSWYYGQGRVLYSALVLGLAIWGLRTLPPSADLSKLAVAFLLPLNIAFFASLSERRTVSPIGLLKIALIAVESVGVVMLGQVRGGQLEAVLRWGLDPAGLSWISLGQQLSFAAASLTL